MKTTIRSLIVLLSMALAPLAAHAADAAAGAKKAITCVACHGKEGISIAPNYPNLACQKDKYLIKAIKDYKSGARKDPIMKPMVGSLSDTDIENLAAYFSTLNCP